MRRIMGIPNFPTPYLLLSPIPIHPDRPTRNTKVPRAHEKRNNKLQSPCMHAWFRDGKKIIKEGWCSGI